MGMVAMLGIAFICYFAGMLALEKKLKRLAFWTGLVGIMSGIFYILMPLSVILLNIIPEASTIMYLPIFLIGTFLVSAIFGIGGMIAAIIMQVILLLRAAKKYKH